jgi:hypothetical protein
MNENDPNGEARRLLADLEHEIEAMWQVLGPHHVRPPTPTAQAEPEAALGEQEEPAELEAPVMEPIPAPGRSAFQERLAKIAAS